MGRPKTHRRRRFNPPSGRNSHIFKRRKRELMTKVEQFILEDSDNLPPCAKIPYRIIHKASRISTRIIVKRLKYQKTHPLRILKNNKDGTKITILKKKAEIPDGYRLINLNQLDKFLSVIAAHGKKCISSVSSIQDQSVFDLSEFGRQGLSSTLSFKCKACGENLDLSTSFLLPNTSHYDINMRSVWGTMATGGGSSSLNELLSTMGVPGLRQQNFSSLETFIGDSWLNLLVQDMKKAGEEERRLAIERNDFHHGVPAITVICDGGWSKRSHKHSYNAMGGVGVIFGAATGKLLHIGVRNKHCYICSFAESRNMKPKEHVCFKNWSESSQGMESDIILEGFLMAEEQHGVRYMRFIGDGDSSVHARIQKEVPIWGQEVSKLECANHACKCLRSNLEKLVEDKPYLKGKGRLTKNVIQRLTKGVRCAIKMRSSETNRREASKKLAHDIKNAIHHVFGYHEKCSDFCQKRPEPSHSEPQKESEDQDLEVADCQADIWKDLFDDAGLLESRYAYPSKELPSIDPEILRDVTFLLNRLAIKTDRLLGNFTTNLAESWMYIRCKFDGGKMTNRCNRGSWQSRCYGGGLRKNFGAAWSPIVWQKVTKVPPTSPFTTHYRQRALGLIRSRKSKKKPDVKARAYKRKQASASKASSKKAKREYGQDCLDSTPDITNQDLQKTTEEFLSNEINIPDSAIDGIHDSTIGQSLSPQWHKERKKRLTSSTFGQIFNRNTNLKTGPLVKRLLYSNFQGNSYTRKGLQEESITIKEYINHKKENKTHVSVSSAGLVISKKSKFLAASPDGYVEEGSEKGLIEVKNLLQNNQQTFQDATKKSTFCLEVRDGKLQLKRNHMYYFQCQGQLNICNAPWVDFVVRRTNPYQIHIERIFRDETLWNEMLPKLESFYKKCLLPELASPRIKTSTGIREPDLPWFQPACALKPTCSSKSSKGQPKSKRVKDKHLQPSLHKDSSPQTCTTLQRRSQRQKRCKFVGRDILHQWIIDEATQEHQWYSGHVLQCTSGTDGGVGSVYEVRYIGESETYLIDHLQEDLDKGSLKFVDI